MSYNLTPAHEAAINTANELLVQHVLAALPLVLGLVYHSPIAVAAGLLNYLLAFASRWMGWGALRLAAFMVAVALTVVSWIALLNTLGFI